MGHLKWMAIVVVTAACIHLASSQSNFTCPGPGRYPDPASTDCTSYYLCVRNSSGVYIANNFTCPTGTYFDPEVRLCDTDSSVCNPDPTTTTTTTTTTTPSPNTNFTCPGVGLFPDPASTDCSTYYLCTLDSSGVYRSNLLPCGDGTLFDPTLGQCSPTYECPTLTPTCKKNFICDTLFTFYMCYNGEPIGQEPYSCGYLLCDDNCSTPCVMDAMNCV